LAAERPRNKDETEPPGSKPDQLRRYLKSGLPILCIEKKGWLSFQDPGTKNPGKSTLSTRDRQMSILGEKILEKTHNRNLLSLSPDP